MTTTITKIHSRGLKAKAIDLTLAPRTILAGPNGSGKTATLQAIEYALTGKIAAVGARPQDLARVTAGNGMSSTVTTDRLTVSRTLTQLDDGSTQTTINLFPSRGERGLQAAQGRIASEFGVGCGIVDVGALLAATDGERAKMILRWASAGHDTAAGAESFFAGISTEPNEDLRRVVMLAALRQAWKDDLPLLDNLSAMRCVAAELLSEAQGNIRGAKEAAARLRDVLSATPAGAPVDLEQRERLQSQLAQIDVEIATADASGTAARQAMRRIEEAERSVVSARKALDTAKDSEDTASAAMIAAKKSVATPEPMTEAPPAPWDATIDAKIDELQRLRDEARTESDRLAGRLRAYRDSAKALVGTTSCPTCRQAVTGDVRKAIADGEKILAAAHDAAVTKVGEASSALSTAQGERASARQKWETAKRDYDRMEREAAGRADARLASRTLAQKEYDRCEAATRAARTELANALERRDTVERETAAIPGAPSEDDVSTMRLQAQQMRAILREQESAMQAITRRAGIEASARQATDDIARCEVAYGIARALQTEVQSEVGRQIGRILGPLEARVSGLLAEVRPGWMATLRPEGNGIGIAVSTDGGERWRPWSSLSGGEAVAFTAALALAVVLIQDAPARWLLLEAAELDPATLVGLLSALSEMGGDFGSILVAHHTAPVTCPEGWTVVDVAAAAVEASR